jgi:hypothetical protein
MVIYGLKKTERLSGDCASITSVVQNRGYNIFSQKGSSTTTTTRKHIEAEK